MLDEKRVVSASEEKTSRVWDVASGELPFLASWVSGELTPMVVVDAVSFLAFVFMMWLLVKKALAPPKSE